MFYLINFLLRGKVFIQDLNSHLDKIRREKLDYYPVGDPPKTGPFLDFTEESPGTSTVKVEVPSL